MAGRSSAAVNWSFLPQGRLLTTDHISYAPYEVFDLRNELQYVSAALI